MTSAPGSGPDTGDEQVVMEWSPSAVISTMWVAMSIVLGLFGLMLFGLIYSLLGPPPPDSSTSFNAPIVAALAAAVLVVHQLLHAGAARLFGGAPGFVVDVAHLIVPVFYCAVPGQRFSRRQFLAYLLLPVVAISALGVVGMLVDYRGAMLIIPLALNLAVAMRDIWMAWVVARQPGDVDVIAGDEGFRLVLPQD